MCVVQLNKRLHFYSTRVLEYSCGSWKFPILLGHDEQWGGITDAS